MEKINEEFFVYRWIEVMLSHQNIQNNSKDKKNSPASMFPFKKNEEITNEITQIAEKIKNNGSFAEGINELYCYLLRDSSNFFKKSKEFF